MLCHVSTVLWTMDSVAYSVVFADCNPLKLLIYDMKEKPVAMIHMRNRQVFLCSVFIPMTVWSVNWYRANTGALLFQMKPHKSSDMSAAFIDWFINFTSILWTYLQWQFSAWVSTLFLFYKLFVVYSSFMNFPWLLSFVRVAVDRSQSQLTLGKRRCIPWISHQVITGWHIQ